MNALVFLAALTAGQCENGVCTVPVEVTVTSPAAGVQVTLPGEPVRRTVGVVRAVVRAQPVRRVVAAVVERQPVRKVLMLRPVRRVGQVLLRGRCR